MKAKAAKVRKAKSSIVRRAEALRRQGKPFEARTLLEQGLSDLKKPGGERDHASGLALLSDLWRGTDNSSKAAKYLKQALNLAEKHDFPDLVCEFTKRRAFLNLLLDNYKDSLSDAFKALEMARTLEDKRLEIGALAVIGHLHEVRKERPKALVWFRQAMALATEINDTWRRAGLYHDLGRIHGELREYLVGLEYLEQGEKYCLKYGYTARHQMMIRAQGDIYRAIGDLGRAKDLYDRSQSDPEKIENPAEALENSTRYGDLYIELGQIDKALATFKRGARVANRLRFKRKVLQNYFGIARCYERKFQYGKALDFYKSIIHQLEGDVENTLSTMVAAFEMSAFVLDKLGEKQLAEVIEQFWRRIQSLDDEGTYTAHRRASMRTELLQQIPKYQQKIIKAQIGVYEVGNISVNPKTGIIKVDNKLQPIPLSEEAERKAFRLLKENLDIPQSAEAIYGTYASEKQKLEKKYIPGRVYALMTAMHNKGIPRSLLYNIRGEGWVLVSKL